MKLDRKGMEQSSAGLSKPCCHFEPDSESRPLNGFSQKRVTVAYLRRSPLCL